MNSSDNPTRKVFISYAHEDREAAKRLFKDLQDYNIEPWMDEDSLLPGQRWELMITEAIKKSQYFIPLLSINSIQEQSYVQKELKAAFKILRELPESEIYVIPLRLDDCQIPDSKLQEIHRVDLFPDWKNGLKKALLAMGIKTESNKLDDDHWNNLLTAIDEKKCVPFIGEAALEFYNQNNDNDFLTSKELAKEWAEKYGYPLEDAQLPKVAQFLAIERGSETFPKEVVSNRLKKNKTDFSLDKFINTTHAILSHFDLPLYITTNYDLFMEEALKSQNKEPVSEVCTWNDDLKTLTKITSVFGKRSKYKPTKDKPLVYHLHGSIQYPQSMVLTERDYFEFVINMNKTDEEQDRLPAFVRTELTLSSLLLIGYSLDDINFRSIFQGALSFLSNMSKPRNSIAVIQIPTYKDENTKEKVIKYLKKYTENMFQIIVYWGDMNDFLKELNNRWKTFKDKDSNKS